MDTIPGDKFIADCARFIRYNEAKLGDVAGRASTSTNSSLNWMNPAAWLMPSASPPPPPPSTTTTTTASNVSGPSARQKRTAAPQPVLLHRPMAFRITSHHLYYILIRCESIGLQIGSLDVRIPARSRPSSYFAFISSNAAGATYRKRDLEETMSINSIQTTMSMFGLGSGTSAAAAAAGGRNGASSWWYTEKQDVNADIKYIYSAMTKLPALRIGPPPLKLVRDFEDCPGEMSVPLDALKNVQFLEFEDADPRAFLGWDRMSLQLRSLSMKRSGVEDVTDIIIDAVLADAKRRKGERVESIPRKVHSTTESEQGDDGGGSRSGGGGDETKPSSAQDVTEPDRLPSLSWHFLRHLSLSDNSLTFLHPTPIACISNLTSLDLSSNLLNAVPPSLNLLPQLRFLNLSNNLIDSVLGIPDCIPHIHALNLSHNRLESLCGLERLAHLSRVDLRHNEVFEAGEVGRLATLDHVAEVYVAGNPLMDEEEDPRVLILAEFAKEGRDLDALKLDDESIGYFERQRVREAVPGMDGVRRRREQTRNNTPSAKEVTRLSNKVNVAAQRAAKDEGTASTASHAGAKVAEEDAPAAEGSVIKSVRHRGASHHHHRAGSRGAPKSVDDKATKTAAHVHSTSEAGIASKSRLSNAGGSSDVGGGGQRRNRRVVKLTDSAHEAEEQPSRSQAIEESDSDLIKRAALAGDMDTAIGSAVGATTTSKATTMTFNSSTNSSTPTVGGDDNDTRGNLRLQDERARQHTTTPIALSSPQMEHLRRSGEASRSSLDKRTNNSTTTGTNDTSAQDLRRKIEALKGEVGDDWMRLLARGESS